MDNRNVELPNEIVRKSKDEKSIETILITDRADDPESIFSSQAPIIEPGLDNIKSDSNIFSSIKHFHHKVQ